MTSSRFERYAPLAGVVFFVLIAVLFFVLDANTPDANDSTTSVVNYWTSHDTRAVLAGLEGGLVVLFFVWFGGSLRSYLRRAEGGDGRLSAIAFAGVVITAAGAAVASNLDFMLGDVADDLHKAGADSVIQTISVIDEDFFLPMLVGFAIMMLATGICTLRFGGLPKWLSWVSILIAVVLFTPAGFFAFMLALIWVLVVSIMIFRRGGDPAPAPAPAPTG